MNVCSNTRKLHPQAIAWEWQQQTTDGWVCIQADGVYTHDKYAGTIVVNYVPLPGDRVFRLMWVGEGATLLGFEDETQRRGR